MAYSITDPHELGPQRLIDENDTDLIRKKVLKKIAENEAKKKQNGFPLSGYFICQANTKHWHIEK